MLLSFMEGPEGRQHYGTQIQGVERDKHLQIKEVLPPMSSIRSIILDVR
jgi:hypothetical protein